MATTADGIWYPEEEDDYDLIADLGAMASSVQAALNHRAGREGNTASRLTARATATVGSTWYDTDQGVFYVFSITGGGTRGDWVRIAPPTDTGWTPITTYGSDARAGDPAPAYRIYGNVAYLRGVVEKNDGTNITAEWNMITLPSNIRPQASITMTTAGRSSAGPMRMYISASTGNVSVRPPDNGDTEYASLWSSWLVE